MSLSYICTPSLTVVQLIRNIYINWTFYKINPCTAIHQGQKNKNLNTLPLIGLYELVTVTFMYLHQRNELPLPLQTLFITNANIHEHNTRHRNDPHIITRRTETLIT